MKRSAHDPNDPGISFKYQITIKVPFVTKKVVRIQSLLHVRSVHILLIMPPTTANGPF